MVGIHQDRPRGRGACRGVGRSREPLGGRVVGAHRKAGVRHSCGSSEERRLLLEGQVAPEVKVGMRVNPRRERVDTHEEVGRQHGLAARQEADLRARAPQVKGPHGARRRQIGRGATDRVPASQLTASRPKPLFLADDPRHTVVEAENGDAKAASTLAMMSSASSTGKTRMPAVAPRKAGVSAWQSASHPSAWRRAKSKGARARAGVLGLRDGSVPNAGIPGCTFMLPPFTSFGYSCRG